MIRVYEGISLDGFAANAGGEPAWDAMPDFDADAYGLPELFEQRAAVVMGRTSLDQGLNDWLPDWPYGELPVYVLTSDPLPPDAPDTVVAATAGPAALVEQLRGASLGGDVHVLGGPRTIRALLDVGGIDQLDLCVLPVLFGTGIALFDADHTPFSDTAWQVAREHPTAGDARRLRLRSARSFPDGAVELSYTPL